VVVTREAARRLGFRDPAEAVDKNLRALILGQEFGLTRSPSSALSKMRASAPSTSRSSR
jgi:hypothetical protein